MHELCSNNITDVCMFILGVQISHRCMQRVQLHLDNINVQLKRLSNTVSRIKTALKKLKEHKDVSDSFYLRDVREV